jgi:hypothetical protein
MIMAATIGMPTLVVMIARILRARRATSPRFFKGPFRMTQPRRVVTCDRAKNANAGVAAGESSILW